MANTLLSSGFKEELVGAVVSKSMYTVIGRSPLYFKLSSKVTKFWTLNS